MGSKKGKKKPGAASAKPTRKAPAEAVTEPSPSEPEVPRVIPAEESGIAPVELPEVVSPPISGEEVQEQPGLPAVKDPENDIFPEPEPGSEADCGTVFLDVPTATLVDEIEPLEQPVEALPVTPQVEALPSFPDTDDEEIHRLLKPEDDQSHDDGRVEPAAVGEPAEHAGDDAWPQDFPRRSEGMKVRVIGGGTPKSPVTPVRASQRKGLEIGFRIGAQKKTAGTPVWDTEESEEEVLRLEAPVEAELPTRLQPMEAPEVAMPFSAIARPKQKKKLTMPQWTIVMAGGTVVLVVGVVLLTQLVGRKKPANPAESRPKYEVEKIVLDESESADFIRNITELNGEAEASLKRFAAAATPEEALKELREPERVKGRFLADWRPWSKPAFEKGDQFDSMLMEGQGRAALGLAGYRGDFSRFLMVFVRMDGKMKLDWEASFGVSEIDIADMPERAGTTPLLVRAIVKKDAYYTAAFPETEYAAYELFDSTRDHHVWGYIQRNSKAEEEVAGFLNQNSYVLAANKDVPAIFRLTRKEEAQPNQFLILDVVQKGWVSP